MKLTKYLCYVTVIILLLNSCASMTPIQVNNNLPSLTKSHYIKQSEVESIIERGNCRYLVKSREYVAPVGITAKNDLKNAARGIDEWVQLDGGNAYLLKNFKWVTVDDSGSTQLHVEFATLLCE